jgi:hypothetical protein
MDLILRDSIGGNYTNRMINNTSEAWIIISDENCHL